MDTIKQSDLDGLFPVEIWGLILDILIPICMRSSDSHVIECGAFVIRNKFADGHTAIYAARYGYLELLKKHRASSDVNDMYQAAVQNRQYAVLRWLKKNTITSITTKTYCTIAKSGYLRALRLLYVHPQNIDRIHNIIETAAKNGQSNIVSWMLEQQTRYGRQLNLQPAYNEACRNGYVEVAKLLLPFVRHNIRCTANC